MSARGLTQWPPGFVYPNHWGRLHQTPTDEKKY